MELINHLKWRQATKNFDPNKKVSEADLEKLKEVIQLSASSYGLQLYKILIIEDKAIREKLKPASWGQNQITDASHLLVFCNYTEVSEAHIAEMMQLKAKVLGYSEEQLNNYIAFVTNKIAEQTTQQVQNWTAKQTYIALANLLLGCAELKIDACPMEGFDPEAYNEILGLQNQGLNAAVLATIGYEKADPAKNHTKVRRPIADLFEER